MRKHLLEARHFSDGWFTKDKNGKIVKSDWTNDSSTIKSGTSQQVDTMLKDVNDGYTVDVRLRKVRFK